MEVKKTRLDKVMKALEGATWEEGKDIGVQILARYVAFRTHIDDDFDYVELLKDIVKAADTWVQEGGSFVIAMAKTARDKKEEEA